MENNFKKIGGLKAALQIDEKLRKNVAEYYCALAEMGDPVKSVNMLAEHITIMVEMLNDFKNKAK